jgi:hypothetical protein
VAERAAKLDARTAVLARVGAVCQVFGGSAGVTFAMVAPFKHMQSSD